MCEEHRWIGVIVTVDDGNGDLDISFMYPHGPTSSFSWPKRKYKCLVSFKHVLCCISSPCIVIGRQYDLMDKDTR